MEKSIYSISRIKGSFASIWGLVSSSFEDFLFQKSALAKKLENNVALDWQIHFSPLEKHIEGLTITTFFSYENPVIAETIREIKYYRNKRLLDSLASFAAEELTRRLEDTIALHPDMRVFFIPIPSHSKRLKEKGFNQAEDMARALLEHLPYNASVRTDILQKIRHTEHQTGLPRGKRLTNLKGAFDVNFSPEENLHQTLFVIVDDVLTTGATMNEACSALRAQGACHLFPLTLARGGE